MGIFKRIWNWIMDFIYDLLEWAMMLLPESPIQKVGFDIYSTFPNIIRQINYFIPIGLMVSFFFTYTTAVTIWYIVRWAMRLSKFIQ